MKPRRVSISTRSKGGPRTPMTTGTSLLFHPLDGESSYGERITSRGWRHPFALLGGAALLAYVIGAISLRAFVDADMVRDWVTPRASAALNRTVHIGDGAVGLLPRPSVRLSNIDIDNAPGLEGPALARIDHVKMDLAWLPLFVGRVRVRGVHVDGAAVHLSIDENGRSNFGDLVPRRSADMDDFRVAPFAAALRRISVSNASLTYFDAPGGRAMGVMEADASIDIRNQGNGAESGWRADATLGSDSLIVRVTGPTEEIFTIEGPSGQFRAWVGTGQHTVEIDSGFLELASDTLELRARVAGFAGPQPSFEIELVGDDVNALTLAALLPKDLRSSLPARPETPVAVELRLSGGLASHKGPSLDATVHVQGVTLRAQGEPVTVDDNVAVEPNGANGGGLARR